jgi:general stress protein 26
VNQQPTAELDARFSSDGAAPTQWTRARELLQQTEIAWLTTVRPDGRPHVTPLIFVWLDEALYVTTGPDERKARNLRQNPHRVVTTGCNTLTDGLDLVLEGEAVRLTDDARLQRVADAYATKYGTDMWNFTVHDGAFDHGAGRVFVYELRPSTAFGFGKGTVFSQTRWQFPTE